MNQRIGEQPKVQPQKRGGTRRTIVETLPAMSPNDHHQISTETRNKVEMHDLLADENDPALKVCT